MSIKNEVTFKQGYTFSLDYSFFLKLREIKLNQEPLTNDTIFLPSSAINYSNKTVSLFDKSFDTISTINNNNNNNENVLPNKVLGTIKNFNSIEEFKILNKIQYSKEAGLFQKYDKCFFHIISYANFKHFSLMYWICVPILRVDGLSFRFEQNNDDFIELKFDDSLAFDIIDESTIVCNYSFCEIDVENGKLELSTLVKNVLIKETIASNVKQFTLYIISKNKNECQTFYITPHCELEDVTFYDIKIAGWEKNKDNKLRPKFINF